MTGEVPQELAEGFGRLVACVEEKRVVVQPSIVAQHFLQRR
jgi:hypothetical protein